MNDEAKAKQIALEWSERFDLSPGWRMVRAVKAGLAEGRRQQRLADCETVDSFMEGRDPSVALALLEARNAIAASTCGHAAMAKRLEEAERLIHHYETKYGLGKRSYEQPKCQRETCDGGIQCRCRLGRAPASSPTTEARCKGCDVRQRGHDDQRCPEGQFTPEPAAPVLGHAFVEPRMFSKLGIEHAAQRCAYPDCGCPRSAHESGGE